MFLNKFDSTHYKLLVNLILAWGYKKLLIYRLNYCRIMQFWNFRIKHCLTIHQKFVRHRLQILSFNKVETFVVKISEAQYKPFSIVFRDRSRTDVKSKMERFVFMVHGCKPLTMIRDLEGWRMGIAAKSPVLT